MSDSRTPTLDRRRVLKTLGASFAGGAALVGSATAKGGADVTRIPLTTFPPLTNPCNGEVITATSGTFQVVMHSHADGGGGWHMIAEGNTQGAKGEGDKGNDYSVSSGFWHEFNAKPPFPVTHTLTATLQAVSKGSAPNFIANIVVHMTVNANGDTTVELGKMKERCRG